MKLKLCFVISLLLFVSCVSQEQKWQGSVEDFTSGYVDELRKLSLEKKQENRFIQYHQPLINSFFIQKADAQTKKYKKRRVRRRPASKNKKTKPLVLKTDAVRKIQKSQAQRMTLVDKYKVKKIIGENENGLVAVRSLDGLSKKEAEAVNKLVEAENKDRQNLYKIIVKSSHYDKKMEETLRKSFFESYQEWAPVGTYYFKDNKWQKK